jgi:hypothetical protein
MDRADQGDFSRLLLKKVEHMEAKQEVARIDRDTALDDVFRTVDKLLQLDGPWSAINIGRAFLKRREFDKCLKVLGGRYTPLLIPTTIFAETWDKKHTYWCRGQFKDYLVFSSRVGILENN